MGMFIKIHVDAAKLADQAAAVAQACPVKIFELKQGRLAVIEAEEDECTLCDLCLERCPGGGIRIEKLY